MQHFRTCRALRAQLELGPDFWGTKSWKTMLELDAWVGVGKDFQHPFGVGTCAGVAHILHILGISPRKWLNLSVLCIRYRYYFFFCVVIM